MNKPEPIKRFIVLVCDNALSMEKLLNSYVDRGYTLHSFRDTRTEASSSRLIVVLVYAPTMFSPITPTFNDIEEGS